MKGLLIACFQTLKSTGGWGIFKWPQVGDFGWPPGAISQQDAMPADVFSKKLVDQLLLKKIPTLIRIGKESTRLPLIKKLPVNLLDRIMIKKFGLEKLKKQRKS